MLKNIPSIIPPELMKIMMEMGHGDELLICDGNYPKLGCPERCVRMDGHGIPEILDAILRFFPLDMNRKACEWNRFKRLSFIPAARNAMLVWLQEKGRFMPTSS